MTLSLGFSITTRIFLPPLHCKTAAGCRGSFHTFRSCGTSIGCLQGWRLCLAALVSPETPGSLRPAWQSHLLPDLWSPPWSFGHFAFCHRDVLAPQLLLRSPYGTQEVLDLFHLSCWTTCYEPGVLSQAQPTGTSPTAISIPWLRCHVGCSVRLTQRLRWKMWSFFGLHPEKRVTSPDVLRVLQITWVLPSSLTPAAWSQWVGWGEPVHAQPDLCLPFLALFLNSFPKSPSNHSSSCGAHTSLLSNLHSALFYDSWNDHSTSLSFDFFDVCEHSRLGSFKKTFFLSEKSGLQNHRVAMRF